jgi:drug/metabolite transporter (DMT)-like permease
VAGDQECGHGDVNQDGTRAPLALGKSAASVAPPDDRRPLTGIALKVVSVAIFVAMSAFIKAAGPVPAGQIVFYRSFFAMVPILAVLAFRRELLTAFHTKRPLGHAGRGVVGVIAMALSFWGLVRLPLPEVIAINYAQPLIVVMLSAIFLGEVVRIFRWSAVIVGLVGVFIISWPKLTLLSAGAHVGRDQAYGALAVLAAAAVSALAMLLVRRLVATEKSSTIVLWFSLTATICALVTLPFGWDELGRNQVFLLVAAGFCGGVAQVLMTESYRHADLSTIAPFEYTSMLLGIAVGYFAFGDVPTQAMLIGSAIVIASGLFIIWREHRLGLERGAARKLVPPQG